MRMSVLGLAAYTLPACPPAHAQTASPDKQLEEKAVAGDAQAQRELGDWYVLPGNHIEGVRWYRKAAEQGNAVAQYNLGLSYNSGLGIPQNYVECVRWYRKAAKQGYEKALGSLGTSYAYGEGIPQNYAEAYVWLSLAAAKSGTGYEDPLVSLREQVAKQLTPTQLAAAQAMSKQCEETNYAKCGFVGDP